MKLAYRRQNNSLVTLFALAVIMARVTSLCLSSNNVQNELKIIKKDIYHISSSLFYFMAAEYWRIDVILYHISSPSTPGENGALR